MRNEPVIRLLRGGLQNVIPFQVPEGFPDSNEPIDYPIDGVLDLHGFNPKEVKDLVPHYLRECQKRGILRVRIIHGKGIGNLQRTVHSLVSKMPEVVSFSLASAEFGHWGATIVHLRPLENGISGEQGGPCNI